MGILAKNKRAYFDYEIEDKLEAGLVLTGQEVKSAKTGGITLTGSYAKIIGGEAALINAQIRPYVHASVNESYDPTQTRRLLLHKSEILKFSNRTDEKGLTLLPLEAYTKKGKIKILLGLGRSRKKTDKREVIKKRESDRYIQKALRKIVAR